MRRARAWWLTTTLAVAIAGGAALPLGHASDHVETLYRKLEVLAEVLGQIEKHYVDTIDPVHVIYGATRGAVGALDSHSAFYTPEEYSDLIENTEGEFAGVGLELGAPDSAAPIEAVFDDSPADRAGLKVGDDVLAIDGRPVGKSPVESLERSLRGPVGARVVLLVRSREEASPREFTLTREWIRVVPLSVEVFEQGVVAIKISTFARRVSSDLAAELGRHPPQKGLILDLRGNPGGLFDEAVGVCDLFLADGLIVSALGRAGRVLDRHEAHAQGTQPGYSIALLIDEASASAAEIVAGALQDRGRARVFGARSFGKGSVQTIIPLSDGSGLKLTVARYVTPAGQQIDGRGIEPDVVISGEDPNLAVETARQWLASQ